MFPDQAGVRLRFPSNGKTTGITLPSADGQEAVIRKAYARADLPFDSTEYVEVSDPLRFHDPEDTNRQSQRLMEQGRLWAIPSKWTRWPGCSATDPEMLSR